MIGGTRTRAAVSSKDAPHATPRVIEAVLARNSSRLRTALADAADVDETDADARTALHHACIQGDRPAVEALLEVGAEPTRHDGGGWTALHYAAQRHDAEIVERLLRAGAEVDATDGHGNTPLFRAVFESRGRGEVIQLLRDAGADKDRKNAHGTSPADLAATIANFDTKQWLE